MGNQPVVQEGEENAVEDPNNPAPSNWWEPFIPSTTITTTGDEPEAPEEPSTWDQITSAIEEFAAKSLTGDSQDEDKPESATEKLAALEKGKEEAEKQKKQREEQRESLWQQFLSVLDRSVTDAAKPSDETVFYLPQLPVDIFRVITTYLDFKSALRLHSITKQFTDEFWENTYLLDLSSVWLELTEERLLYILTTKPIKKLRSLNLSYCNRINFSSIQKLGPLPYLTELDLSHWLQMTTIEWTHLLQLHKLRKLVLNYQNCTCGVPLNDICSRLTNLTHLEAEYCRFRSTGGIQQLSKLRVLSLGFEPVNSYSPGGVSYFDNLAPLSNLEELYLSAVPAQPLLRCRNLSEAFPNLLKLHLVDCKDVDDEFVIHLLSSLPNLHDFSIAGCAVTGVSEGELREDTNFELYHRSRAEPAVITKYLSSQLNLRYLNPSGAQFFLNSHDLQQLSLPSSPEIWRLTCRVCSSIDVGVQFGSPKFRHLGYIDVSNSFMPYQDMVDAVACLISLHTLVMKGLIQSFYPLPPVPEGEEDSAANRKPIPIPVTFSPLSSLFFLRILNTSAYCSVSSLASIPWIEGLAVSAFDPEEDFIRCLKHLPKLRYLKVPYMMRVNLEGLTKLEGLYTFGRWKHYFPSEKTWKSSPHTLVQEFAMLG